MNLLPISGRVAYLPGANNLGVIADDQGGAVVVDTGIDKDAARALRRALDGAGLTLRAIINTHHHADHVGGNAALLRHYPQTQVYATPLEAALIQHPLLEPIYLNGGACPPAALRGKWLLAPGSPIHHLLGATAAPAPGTRWQADLGVGLSLELVALPGHSPAQIGVLVDGVCLVADSFFGTVVLEKHGLPYAYDVAAQLASLDALAKLDAAWFLPGHGALIARPELATELEANRQAIVGASHQILAALAEPGDLATLTARILRARSQQLAGVAQYAIFSGAVAAHLSYLEQQGAARLELDGEGLRWSIV